jgi:peptidoglycan/LPS O-acetylase OafA/YrhL
MSQAYHAPIDGLRALAALAVLAFHVRLPGFDGGFLGVEVFFILSGYLTARALSGHRTPPSPRELGALAAHRLRRLWPLLATVTVATTITFWIAGAQLSIRDEVLPALTWTANFGAAANTGPHLMIHTWTLATELQFYLVLLAIVWALGSRSKRLGSSVLASLWLALTIWRCVHVGTADISAFIYHPEFRGSGLFLGAALAFLPRAQLRIPATSAFGAALVLAAGIYTADMLDAASLALWVPLAELAATALLLVAVAAQPGDLIHQGLGNRVARRLGELSFGIYLWHYPIARVLRDVHDPVVTFGLTAVGSIALAHVSWRYVERPFSLAPRGRTATDRQVQPA